MEAQEIFNTVVTHLRTQNAKAMNLNNDCQYRSDDGLKCAVGCLISDEDYDEKFEGRTVRDLCQSNMFSLDLESMIVKNIDLLSILQRIHDNNPIDQWEEFFSDVAHDFKLELIPVK